MTLVNPPQACACWISIKESTAQTLNGTGIFTYIDPIKRLAIHVGKYPPQLMVWGPVVWDSKDPRKWKGLGFLGSTGNIPNEKNCPVPRPSSCWHNTSGSRGPQMAAVDKQTCNKHLCLVGRFKGPMKTYIYIYTHLIGVLFSWLVVFPIATSSFISESHKT